MDFSNNKINISYPLDLIDHIDLFPQNHVVPCSVLVDHEEIGGIFMVYPPQEMEFFNNIASLPPNPRIKFRMLDSKKLIFLVEIWIQFSEDPKEYLKMHLNPHDRSVKKLLELGSKTNMISFHLYDRDTLLLSSAITNFNDEQTNWFDRNYKLSRKLISNQRGYEILAEYLCNEVSSTDRIFKYYNQKRNNFFVREGGKQVIMRKILK